MQNELTINILGTGCPNCKKLVNNTTKAIEELGLKASINKITEIEDIMAYGVMNLPAIVINNEIISSGKVLTTAEVKELLSDQTKSSNNTESNCCCSCKDGC